MEHKANDDKQRHGVRQSNDKQLQLKEREKEGKKERIKEKKTGKQE